MQILFEHTEGSQDSDPGEDAWHRALFFSFDVKSNPWALGQHPQSKVQ